MQPTLVHHKAALDGQYPPNSLEAIRACLAADAPFIEVDIVALAADDYVLLHDHVLDHETTGHGAVAETAPDALAQVFHLFDGEPSPYPVARLSDVVRAMLEAGGRTRIQLDFKNVIPFDSDEPLERLIQLIAPLQDRVIVSSGADWQLRRMRRLAPWLDLGLDVHYYIDWRTAGEAVDPRQPPYRQGAYGYWDDHPLATQRFYSMRDYLADRCASLAGLVPGCSTFYLNYTMVMQALKDGFNWAEACHEHGIRLDIWTLDVHDEQRRQIAIRLREMGVDLFTTNTPTALAAALQAGA